MGTADYVATFYTGRKECGWRMVLTLVLSFMMLMVFAVPSVMALGTAAGTVIKNKATATYKDANGNDMASVESNEVETTVSQVATVDVTPATASQSGTSGGYTAYAVTVCNKGNDSDTIDLSQLTTPPGAQTWTASIVNDEDQDGVYDPGEDTNVITDTGALAADGGDAGVALPDPEERVHQRLPAEEGGSPGGRPRARRELVRGGARGGRSGSPPSFRACGALRGRAFRSGARKCCRNSP